MTMTTTQVLVVVYWIFIIFTVIELVPSAHKMNYTVSQKTAVTALMGIFWPITWLVLGTMALKVIMHRRMQRRADVFSEQIVRNLESRRYSNRLDDIDDEDAPF